MIVTVTSGDHLIKAAKNAETMGITKIIIDAEDITINAPVKLPKRLKALSKQLIIEGNGTTIKAGVPMPYMIGRDAPIDANEANNVMQSQGFSIDHMLLDCKGLSGAGIYQRCSYHNEINKVTAISATNAGIIDEFGMNSRITLCETRNISGVGIYLKNGAEWGGGYNKSGSNMSQVVQCRSFPKQGQTACFRSDASGNITFDGCTVDASTNNTPQRGFQVVNDNSTTCKNVTIRGAWAETVTSVAMFDLSLTGGYAAISGVFPQYGGTMVRAVGTNYSEVYVTAFGNVHGSAKFEAVDQDTVWYWGNNATSYDFLNPANWIGGVLPGKYFLEGFINNKEYGYRSVGAVKLNGQKLVTEDVMNAAITKAITP